MSPSSHNCSTEAQGYSCSTGVDVHPSLDAGPELPYRPEQRGFRSWGLTPRCDIRNGGLEQRELGPSSGKFSYCLFRL